MEKVSEVTGILVDFAKDLVKFVEKVMEFFNTYFGDDDEDA